MNLFTVLSEQVCFKTVTDSSALAPALLCSRALLFFPHFLRWTTRSISYSSSSHPTSWLKWGVQHIWKCHPTQRHSIPGWNTGMFFIPSHFPNSSFLFPKFGTASLAAYHCPATCFFMAFGITVHVLRWHFRGSLVCWFFFHDELLQRIGIFLLSLVAKFLTSCTIYKFSTLLTNALSLHCKWLWSVWLFPIFWNYLYYESLIIYGDIHGAFLGHAFRRNE